MDAQVESSHYEFGEYVHKERWASMWHQLDDVIALHPNRVLEIGPGPGLFRAAAISLGLNIETLDLDPALHPDHVASVFDMPFDDNEFDVVCAFQMLEHLPLDQSMEALTEMARVARTNIVISLPDAAVRWPISIRIPRLGLLQFSIPKPRLRLPRHEFDGEHYWEINTRGCDLDHICELVIAATSMTLDRTYRVPEYPYHRFFKLTKPDPATCG